MTFDQGKVDKTTEEWQYGDEKVIALKGNHEVWFEDFLADRGRDWLAEDKNYKTSGKNIYKG